MKHRLVRFGLAAVLVGSLSACSDGGSAAVSMAPPAPGTSQGLDTAQVRAEARAHSETTDPYAVNSGAVYLTDTLDTTDPAVITGT